MKECLEENRMQDSFSQGCREQLEEVNLAYLSKVKLCAYVCVRILPELPPVPFFGELTPSSDSNAAT